MRLALNERRSDEVGLPFGVTIVAAVKTPEGTWMGADSLASSDDLRVDSTTPKLFRFQNFLLGISGSYAIGGAVVALMKVAPTITVKELVDYRLPGSDWELLLADARGVYEYAAGGGLVKMSARKGCSYGVVGSGSAVALGSLYSWHDGREALVSSLHAAETHTNRVRRPFKVMQL